MAHDYVWVMAILAASAGEPPEDFEGPFVPVPKYPEFSSLPEALQEEDERENVIGAFLDAIEEGNEKVVLTRYELTEEQVRAAILYEEEYSKAKAARRQASVLRDAKRRAAWAYYYAALVYTQLLEDVQE